MTHNPHDALFKAVFGDPRHPLGFLRHALPAEVVAGLDLATLRRSPGSFVDPDLPERHTDLLFVVRLGGAPALLYLLFEHQSSHDPMMPCRCLRYMVRIWERWLARTMKLYN